MLKPHENSHTDTSRTAPVFELNGTERVAHTERPILTLRVGADQHPGIRRTYRPNEDTLFVMQGNRISTTSAPQSFVLLGVADGMGGPAHGHKASCLAAASLADYVFGFLCYDQRPADDLLSLLTAGVQHANRIIYEYNRQQRMTMGTTITVALISETTAYIVHVGDSRCYLQRAPMGLTQVTHDHSFVATLVADGIITPDEIYTHPRRNLIYGCLGNQATVEVDTLVLPLASDDTLLLCSDGLWEMVRDPRINAILSAPLPGPSDTACELIQTALEGGGDDDMSAIVVQVSEGGTATTGVSGTVGAQVAACQSDTAADSLPIA